MEWQIRTVCYSCFSSCFFSLVKIVILRFKSTYFSGHQFPFQLAFVLLEPLTEVFYLQILSLRLLDCDTQGVHLDRVLVSRLLGVKHLQLGPKAGQRLFELFTTRASLLATSFSIVRNYVQENLVQQPSAMNNDNTLFWKIFSEDVKGKQRRANNSFSVPPICSKKISRHRPKRFCGFSAAALPRRPIKMSTLYFFVSYLF